MSKPLAKLTIGLVASVASGFYYLAAAPPAAAQLNVCGPGNFSSACPPDTAPKDGLKPIEKITDPYVATAVADPSITSVPEPSLFIGLLFIGGVMVCTTKKRSQVRQ